MSVLSRFIGRLRQKSGRRALANRPISDIHDLLKRLREVHDNQVLSGPFQGLKYGNLSFGSTHLPKLLGTYERELSHLFSKEELESYETFVNLGCAEGYYTNGIAHALKNRADGNTARVFGIDINEQALAESGRISALNGVHIIVATEFNFATTTKLPRHTLIICDVEGAEMELLQPDRFSKLDHVDLIVEVHDPPGKTVILDELQRRFAPSHEISVISFKPRETTDYPAKHFPPMDDGIKLEAMDERRGRGLRWLHLKSKRRWHP